MILHTCFIFECQLLSMGLIYLPYECSEVQGWMSLGSVLPSLLRDRIVGREFWVSSVFQCLVVSIVSDNKLAETYRLYVPCHFPLAAFKIFSLSSVFGSLTMMCLGVVFCFLSRMLSFLNLYIYVFQQISGSFSHYFFQIFSLFHPFHSCDPSYPYVIPFDIVPQSLRLCSSSSPKLFSPLGWVTSVVPPLYLLTLSMSGLLFSISPQRSYKNICQYSKILE